MADELIRAFREVGEIGKGSWFRGAPFWSWNDKLDPEELRRQIREFHQQGIGGFFMHARIGLDTPYMSEEWMQAVAACVDEAKKLGMLAWLYDEDKWPSGFAGGIVSGRGGDYNQQLLRAREIPVDWNMREFIPHDRSLAVYIVTRKGRQWLGSLEGLFRGEGVITTNNCFAPAKFLLTGTCVSSSPTTEALPFTSLPGKDDNGLNGEM